MEALAEDLLTEVDGFVKSRIAGGIILTSVGEAHWNSFQRLFGFVSTNPRVKEGQEKPPQHPIDLEAV
jgi:hypothetical protein